MENLSEYQQEVLNKMGYGTYLWMNEGSNYSCWLGDSKGKKFEFVKRTIVEELFALGQIELIEGEYRDDWYKYNKKGNPIVENCEECCGGGFSKPGTGYDSICDNCGGQGLVLDLNSNIS